MSALLEWRALGLARYLRHVRATSEVSIEGDLGERQIVGIWHESLYLALAAAAGIPGLAVYAWDDARAHLITRVAQRAGLHVLEASASNLHGARAVLGWLAKPGRTLVIALDGPLGPPRIAKQGAWRFAALAGVPLRGARVSVDRAVRLPTWDGRYMPDPSNRIAVSLGPPVPPDDDVAVVQAALARSTSCACTRGPAAGSLHSLAARVWARACAGPLHEGRIVLGPEPLRWWGSDGA